MFSISVFSTAKEQSFFALLCVILKLKMFYVDYLNRIQVLSYEKKLMNIRTTLQKYINYCYFKSLF